IRIGLSVLVGEAQSIVQSALLAVLVEHFQQIRRALNLLVGNLRIAGFGARTPVAGDPNRVLGEPKMAAGLVVQMKVNRSPVLLFGPLGDVDRAPSLA